MIITTIRKRQVYLKLISLVTASFFFLNVFTADVLALAPELRTKPFSETTKIEFELVAKMMSAAGEIRGLIKADNARENPIIRLNGHYFPNGEVEIDKVIHSGSFKCSGRAYNYALFHFKKSNKDIKAIFIRDHDKLEDKDKLTDDELAELGVKTDEDKRHFFNSTEHPALRGVWFVADDLSNGLRDGSRADPKPVPQPIADVSPSAQAAADVAPSDMFPGIPSIANRTSTEIPVRSEELATLALGQGIDGFLDRVFKSEKTNKMRASALIRQFLASDYPPVVTVRKEVDLLSDEARIKLARELIKDENATGGALCQNMTLEQVLLLSSSEETYVAQHMLGRWLGAFDPKQSSQYRELYKEAPEALSQDQMHWKAIYAILRAAESMRENRDSDHFPAQPAASELPNPASEPPAAPGPSAGNVPEGDAAPKASFLDFVLKILKSSVVLDKSFPAIIIRGWGPGTPRIFMGIPDLSLIKWAYREFGPPVILAPVLIAAGLATSSGLLVAAGLITAASIIFKYTKIHFQSHVVWAELAGTGMKIPADFRWSIVMKMDGNTAGAVTILDADTILDAFKKGHVYWSGTTDAMKLRMVETLAGALGKDPRALDKEDFKIKIKAFGNKSLIGLLQWAEMKYKCNATDAVTNLKDSLGIDESILDADAFKKGRVYWSNTTDAAKRRMLEVLAKALNKEPGALIPMDLRESIKEFGGKSLGRLLEWAKIEYMLKDSAALSELKKRLGIKDIPKEKSVKLRYKDLKATKRILAANPFSKDLPESVEKLLDARINDKEINRLAIDAQAGNEESYWILFQLARRSAYHLARKKGIVSAQRQPASFDEHWTRVFNTCLLKFDGRNFRKYLNQSLSLSVISFGKRQGRAKERTIASTDTDQRHSGGEVYGSDRGQLRRYREEQRGGDLPADEIYDKLAKLTLMLIDELPYTNERDINIFIGRLRGKRQTDLAKKYKTYRQRVFQIIGTVLRRVQGSPNLYKAFEDAGCDLSKIINRQGKRRSIGGDGASAEPASEPPAAPGPSAGNVPEGDAAPKASFLDFVLKILKSSDEVRDGLNISVMPAIESIGIFAMMWSGFDLSGAALIFALSHIPDIIYDFVTNKKDTTSKKLSIALKDFTIISALGVIFTLPFLINPPMGIFISYITHAAYNFTVIEKRLPGWLPVASTLGTGPASPQELSSNAINVTKIRDLLSMVDGKRIKRKDVKAKIIAELLCIQRDGVAIFNKRQAGQIARLRKLGERLTLLEYFILYQKGQDSRKAFLFKGTHISLILQSSRSEKEIKALIDALKGLGISEGYHIALILQSSRSEKEINKLTELKRFIMQRKGQDYPDHFIRYILLRLVFMDNPLPTLEKIMGIDFNAVKLEIEGMPVNTTRVQFEKKYSYMGIWILKFFGRNYRSLRAVIRGYAKELLLLDIIPEEAARRSIAAPVSRLVDETERRLLLDELDNVIERVLNEQEQTIVRMLLDGYSEEEICREHPDAIQILPEIYDKLREAITSDEALRKKVGNLAESLYGTHIDGTASQSVERPGDVPQGDTSQRAQPTTPPPGSIYSVFKYLCDNNITSPDIAISGETLAKSAGEEHEARQKGLSFESIEDDLRGLLLHLHLIEKAPGSETGKDARYYVPEAVKKKSTEILPILEQFRGKDLRPNIALLDQIYEEQIKPILEAPAENRTGPDLATIPANATTKDEISTRLARLQKIKDKKKDGITEADKQYLVEAARYFNLYPESLEKATDSEQIHTYAESLVILTSAELASLGLSDAPAFTLSAIDEVGNGYFAHELAHLFDDMIELYWHFSQDDRWQPSQHPDIQKEIDGIRNMFGGKYRSKNIGWRLVLDEWKGMRSLSPKIILVLIDMLTKDIEEIMSARANVVRYIKEHSSEIGDDIVGKCLRDAKKSDGECGMNLIQLKAVKHDILHSDKIGIIDINKLIQLASKPYEKDGRFAMQLHLAPDIPNIYGNDVKVSYLWINLFRNSIDAIREARGKDETRKGNIVVKTQVVVKDSNRFVDITVSDDGIGIPTAVLQSGRLFQKGVTTKRSGNGLGLYLIKQTVEEMGGTIDVQSELGKGTVFSIKLPIAKSGAENRDSDHFPAQPAASELPNPASEPPDRRVDMDAVHRTVERVLDGGFSHLTSDLFDVNSLVYALAVRHLVNPQGRPLRAIYGGAGADISSALIMFDAVDNDFVSDYSDLDLEDLQWVARALRRLATEGDYALLSLGDIDSMLRYFNSKRDLGRAHSSDTRIKKLLRMGIVMELNALRIRDITVDAVAGIPRIRFQWDYFGLSPEREYSIKFVNADITNPEQYPESLKERIRKGFDVFLLKGGFEIARSYRTQGDGNFVRVLHRGMLPGAWFVTDDHYVTIQTDPSGKKYGNPDGDASSEFPLGPDAYAEADLPLNTDLRSLPVEQRYGRLLRFRQLIVGGRPDIEALTDRATAGEEFLGTVQKVPPHEWAGSKRIVPVERHAIRSEFEQPEAMSPVSADVSLAAIKADLSAEASSGSIVAVKAEADRIHAENMKRENMPAIADKEMLCHIVTDTILPSDQRNMLKVSVDQAMDRANKHIERIVSLSGENATDPDKYIEDLRALMGRKRAEYAKLGYTNVRFTVACPDVGLVDKVLGSGLDIKALAFEPSDSPQYNIVQVEGIMLALRALDSRDLAKLKSVYAFLAKHALSPEDAAITDFNTFIRKVSFILPAAKVEDYELKRTLHYLAYKIWQAA